MHTHLRLITLLAVLTGLLSESDAIAQQPVAQTVRIGFLADKRTDRSDRMRTMIKQELIGLAGSEFTVEFPEAYDVVGEGTFEDVATAVARLANDDALDVLVTLDFIGSQIAVVGAPWARPVVASFVVDARLQGLPLDGGTSGTANLTYVTVPAPIARDLQMLQQLAPTSTVEMLIDEKAVTGFGEFVDRVREEAADIGIDLRVVPVGASADSALASISADAEAVYVVPLDQMPRVEFQRLVDGINARRLPSFAFDARDVEAGILASLSPGSKPRLARRIAINVHRILLGDDPATFTVYFAPDEELVMNMRTVRQTEVVPALGLILEARRLFQNPEGIAREVTLQSAMQEAIRGGLSLAIQDETVASGRQDVRLATADLLPSIGVDLTGTTISKSVAEAATGTNPQNSLDGRISAQQLIFSEPTWANASIQRSIQRSREWDRSTVELDVALEAAEAYLNVLRAKTLEAIQADNLALTRTSRRLAEVREQIGAAGPGERLRLEAELSQRRADAIDAYAQRYAAEITLNQILNRPLAEQFVTPESDLDGRELMRGTFGIDYLEDLRRLPGLADFLSIEALDAAPEIRALDEEISAQDRLLSSTGLAYFLPTIALQAQLSTNLAKDGAGSSFPGGVLSTVTDYPWSIGISASLPLFEGTARRARQHQASAELTRLQLQRDLAAQQIEQSVRTQLQFAQATFAIVAEAEASAVASSRSLELVTDSYAQGITDVVDLLEAQTRALVAERSVANAVYDYLINVKRVERAFGGFETLRPPDEHRAFLARLRQFYEGSQR